VGIGVLSQPQLIVRFMTVKSNKELNRAVLVGGIFIALMTGTAFIVGALSNVYFLQNTGHIAITAAGGNADKIIPLFISTAMPLWFAYIFMITLISAAMSTLSSQFHVQGTALGRDVYETLTKRKGGSTVVIARGGIVIAVLIAVVLGFSLPANIIAVGTALWFSLTAAAFLTMYVCAIFWKRSTTSGVITGMITGTIVSVFWLLFVYTKSATALGISNLLFGKATLITGMPWNVMDPIVVGLPVAAIFTVVITLLTRPPSKKHLEKCFEGL
jgi:SSS family solute:Na+ symporter